MKRSIPKRRLPRRTKRIGEIDLFNLIANRIASGQHTATVRMCHECIDREHIGEEISTRPWMW